MKNLKRLKKEQLIEEIVKMDKIISNHDREKKGLDKELESLYKDIEFLASQFDCIVSNYKANEKESIFNEEKLTICEGRLQKELEKKEECLQLLANICDEFEIEGMMSIKTYGYIREVIYTRDTIVSCQKLDRDELY